MVEKSVAAPPVEHIPSHNGQVSALGSANAPFIYFDFAASFGNRVGIVSITLEALRLMPGSGEFVPTDRVVVAHLRIGIEAAISLKQALEQAIAMPSLKSSTVKN